MGWKSGADPMHNMTIQMKFDNALQAMNFAKQQYRVSTFLQFMLVVSRHCASINYFTFLSYFYLQHLIRSVIIFIAIRLELLIIFVL